MSDTNFGLRIDGKILNTQEILDICKDSPAIFKTHFLKYLRYAGNQLIGSKRKDGAVRKVLNTKKNVKNGDGWRSQFVNLFNYKLDTNNMQMRAGLLYTNKKKVHQIMELMEQGGKIRSNKYMIMPIWRNTYETKLGNFFKMSANKQLKMIFARGKIFYIDKNTNNLLYIGTKEIDIKRQFNFDSLVDSVSKKIIKKSGKVIEAATEDARKHNKLANFDWSGG